MTTEQGWRGAPSALPRHFDALAVAAVALAARLLVVAWAAGRFPPTGDGTYYDTLARRLAAGAGYTWAWPDGAVTYAAHYPVGYPALLAAVYTVFGPAPASAMVFHAAMGAAAAFSMHRLVDGPGVERWRPASAGLAFALHPALLPYTAALMTEGVTAALLVMAAALASSGRSALAGSKTARGTGAARAAAWLAAGVAMGVATLVRPQCLALAPVLGALAPAAGAGLRVRAASVATVVAVALACVAPWTARNCVRMHRCALVSVNEGWNLLIGTATDDGGWHEVAVPHECTTVWDEAAKDRCFERAALGDIARAPGVWLARAPAKIAMTLDYIGAAPWYLHASNPHAFGHDAKIALVAVETFACRVLLLAALAACGRRVGAPRARARKGLALFGAVAAVGAHAWLGYVALVGVVALCGARALARAPLVVPFAVAVIVATVAVHAVFFGSGRYGLMVVPFVVALAFAASASRPAPTSDAMSHASTPLG